MSDMTKPETSLLDDYDASTRAKRVAKARKDAHLALLAAEEALGRWCVLVHSTDRLPCAVSGLIRDVRRGVLDLGDEP